MDVCMKYEISYLEWGIPSSGMTSTSSLLVVNEKFLLRTDESGSLDIEKEWIESSNGKRELNVEIPITRYIQGGISIGQWPRPPELRVAETKNGLTLVVGSGNQSLASVVRYYILVHVHINSYNCTVLCIGIKVMDEGPLKPTLRSCVETEICRLL